MPSIKELTVDAFARRLLRRMDEDARFAFFLGAGCSITSGIPGAGTLVRQWLGRLKHEATGTEKRWEEWARTTYGNHDGPAAASLYGRVIKALFHTAEERQQEFDRLIGDRHPGFGYGVLAQLMSHPTYGPKCRAVLTTNFDDLVADALYLYSSVKPQVIAHESLARFARTTSVKPLVVKLHGDVRFVLKNTEEETCELEEGLRAYLGRQLHESGLIFMGYGGNDRSIAEALAGLKNDSLPGGIYWVNSDWPDNDLGAWLERRDAIWVRHQDFDEAMLWIQDVFSLDHPDDQRYQRVLNDYYGTFKTLAEKNKPGRGAPETEQAVQRAIEKAPDAWTIGMKAEAMWEADPERAERLYQEGLAHHGQDAALLGSYAAFLHSIRKDYDRAEEHYVKALAADPNDAHNLGKYASFLHTIRKDSDRAEDHYVKALAADPDSAPTLGNYANFLNTIRKNYDGAEGHYVKALAADPDDADAMGNYAAFLHSIRKDYDRAEEYYVNALAADSDHANILGNYAVFLNYVRKDLDRAEEHYVKALAADPEHAHTLGNFAGFLLGRGRYEEGMRRLAEGEPRAEDESLQLELAFYRFAHDRDSAGRDAALERARALIAAGGRSPGWDFSGNIERAIADGHPCPELLTALAKVIADEAPAVSLEAFLPCPA